MELVGKWVLLEPDTHGSICTVHPWLVVNVSGKRIYLERPEKVDKEGYKERKEEKWVLVKTVTYVFDNEEDAILAGTEADQIAWNWWTAQQKQAKQNQRNVVKKYNGTFCKEK